MSLRGPDVLDSGIRRCGESCINSLLIPGFRVSVTLGITNPETRNVA